VDGRALHVFDPASGRNMSLGNAGAQSTTLSPPAPSTETAPEAAPDTSTRTDNIT
jgi:hypothetical protein